MVELKFRFVSRRSNSLFQVLRQRGQRTAKIKESQRRNKTHVLLSPLLSDLSLAPLSESLEKGKKSSHVTWSVTAIPGVVSFGLQLFQLTLSDQNKAKRQDRNVLWG